MTPAHLEKWIDAARVANLARGAAAHERDYYWPLGVPLDELRLREAAPERAWRRHPINEHKPARDHR